MWKDLSSYVFLKLFEQFRHRLNRLPVKHSWIGKKYDRLASRTVPFFSLHSQTVPTTFTHTHTYTHKQTHKHIYTRTQHNHMQKHEQMSVRYQNEKKKPAGASSSEIKCRCLNELDIIKDVTKRSDGGKPF